MSSIAVIALVLILARAIAELWLSRLNQRHVRAHSTEVPSAFREIVDEPTYLRSVEYTLAKGRFGEVVTVFDAVLLIALLFSGVLRSEEHTSELQSRVEISYAVFCLKKKKSTHTVENVLLSIHLSDTLGRPASP